MSGADFCRYESTLNTYKHLLGIRAAHAVSPSQLVLEYDTPLCATGARLTLLFDGPRLVDAELAAAGGEGAELDPSVDTDMREAVATAVDRNDAAGLIADVLVRLRPL